MQLHLQQVRAPGSVGVGCTPTRCEGQSNAYRMGYAVKVLMQARHVRPVISSEHLVTSIALPLYT
jgi:hypothetical protein